MEKEFKVLMHCGEYVNPNLLEKGIYACDTPHLYSKETTINSIIEIGKKMGNLMGIFHISDSYFNNLKSCILVDIIIEEKHKIIEPL